jgi:hypothetical protein
MAWFNDSNVMRNLDYRPYRPSQYDYWGAGWTHWTLIKFIRDQNSEEPSRNSTPAFKFCMEINRPLV